MTDAYNEAVQLRAKLHTMPESSNHEYQTKQTLMAYLRQFPDLQVIDKGKWFYAAHREGSKAPSIGFRAEMDAMTGVDGKPYHGCGHDGHASVMAALAAWTSGKNLEKNVFFLFQHAEETGEGAAECLELFDCESIDSLYGFHNCPGFPAGSVLLLPNTFACASRGVIFEFDGIQSHAAYPQYGKNPVFPMAKFFSRWEEFTNPDAYKGMVLATPICVNAGSHAFGVAAGTGEICLTLRAWYNEDLEKLQSDMTTWAAALAEEAGIPLRVSTQDVFYAAVNSPKLFRHCETAAKKAGLATLTPSEPFRWSEDFGRYGSRTRTCFVGIGSGEDAPGLHTPQYVWNDEVTKSALKLFKTIITE